MRRRLIPGAVLVGFAELFDKAFGDPKTQKPYPRVTPSRVGSSLLPFLCPHCGEVCPVVVDPKKRDGYRDPERDFSWCPKCGGRFVINPKGQPLKDSLPAGATSAPALVERNGQVKSLKEHVTDGLSVLGTM